MINKSYKVLLVEDVELIAKITTQMLKKSPTNKYTSVWKLRLDESLEILKTEEFDVILLDLNLPDSAELDTLTRVIEACPEVPIIVLTASNGDEIGLRAVQLGAQDFLQKGEFNHLALDRAIVYAIERHRLQRTIRQLAVIDELTGLYNRRGFNTLNPDVIQRVKRSELRGYLCYFDLDRFKQINDELGHAKGDEALVEFANTLRNVFRKDPLLVRFGGDEFVAMGIEQQPGQVVEILRVMEIVLSVRNTKGASGFNLEASAGVTYFDKNGPHVLEELTVAADAALYKNKESRRQARKDTNPALQTEGVRT